MKFHCSVPTMVSQNWFPESERLIATGILSLSMPLGMVLGQGITPTFVTCKSDISIMNIVWFSPTVITFIICIFGINSDHPPTPPSRSAELAMNKDKKFVSRADLLNQYLSNLKSVFTNREFIILFVVLGGAVGFVNAFFTQLSQMMCARGYNNVFSGMCGSLLLGTGFIGAIISGLLVEKFGNIEQVTKLFFGFAVLCGLLIAQLLRESNLDVIVAISFALFGVFAFGMYPLGLELALEVTYPVDESISTAMIFMSGQMQGGILVVASMFMEDDLSTRERHYDVCTLPATNCGDSEDAKFIKLVTGKDHTNFLLLLSVFMSVLCVLFYFGFKTKFRRSEADQVQEGKEDHPSTSTTNL